MEESRPTSWFVVFKVAVLCCVRILGGFLHARSLWRSSVHEFAVSGEDAEVDCSLNFVFVLTSVREDVRASFGGFW